ncbi:MAG TPA: hypothetical protein VKU62_09445 [Thermoanaerobaculia bacterium]|nr:hypothetical protein [Thermoanaerobaculia bacterium]
MPIVIKQYGERRTGTNYVRALMQANYPEALVLTYILGDKHSPPAPLDAIWDAAQSSVDPELEFVRRATLAVRSQNSHDGDITQLAEMRKRAAAVAQAQRSGTMRFVITIKDPYAWIVSVARFHQWVHNDVETLHDWDCDQLREMCLQYNRHYAAWRQLTQANPSRVAWIRYEDLLGGAEAAFRNVELTFGLSRERDFVDLPERIEPSWWDHLPVLKSESFDRSYYLERRYFERLQPMHMDIIAATIDWAPLTQFRYEPV